LTEGRGGSLGHLPLGADPRRFPRLCAICDADASARAGLRLRDAAAALLDGGARFIQLRGKGLSSAALLAEAQTLVRAAEPFGATIIVNDRGDVARLAGAHGVHLGQTDLSPAAVRPIVGDAAIIGLSTHTDTQVMAAAAEPVDYVAIGPVFGTATKATGYAPVGLDAVRRASRCGKPVVAIGGITVETAAAVIAAGAASVAVIGDLLATGSVARRVRDFLEVLQ
jgi:thiamine-phosphate pyrophosphorylase